MIIIFGYIYNSNSALIEQELEVNKENSAISEISEISGNAALQSIACARAGARAALCGNIGNDLYGKNILDTLRREGVNTTGVAKHDTEKTGNLISIKSPNSQTAIKTTAANKFLNAEQLPNTSLNQRTLLLLQTDLPPKINADILKRAQTHGSKSILSITNPENLDDELVALADLVIEKTAQNKKGYNCFCGTLAACLQAGMDQETAELYAQTAGNLASKNGGGYSALPYLDSIEKALQS